MKKIHILFASVVLSAYACNSREEAAEPEAHPKVPVEVVNVSTGSISDNLELSATSIYLRRNLVTAPISGYITRVNTRLGDRVERGQVLYQLESKERRALGTSVSAIDSTIHNFGLVSVKATASGVVSTFDKQQSGEYVLEGSTLCTIAQSNDLVFQVNVPYEFSGIVKPGRRCTIVLPDNSRHSATITTPLTSMNLSAQTQTLLARPDGGMFLPENLIAKVEIAQGTTGNQQILPKSCILSDEMMKEFWVMKLTNDSTAVKVPVTLGNKNAQTAEVVSPRFSPSDRIISAGNYGLPDTALVSIDGKK